jgi:hypothetical protein
MNCGCAAPISFELYDILVLVVGFHMDGRMLSGQHSRKLGISKWLRKNPRGSSGCKTFHRLPLHTHVDDSYKEMGRHDNQPSLLPYPRIKKCWRGWRLKRLRSRTGSCTIDLRCLAWNRIYRDSGKMIAEIGECDPKRHCMKYVSGRRKDQK